MICGLGRGWGMKGTVDYEEKVGALVVFMDANWSRRGRMCDSVFRATLN